MTGQSRLESDLNTSVLSSPPDLAESLTSNHRWYLLMDHLFVYGTLGPGRPNEHVMQKIGGAWEAASLKGCLIQAGWGADMGFQAW